MDEQFDERGENTAAPSTPAVATSRGGGLLIAAVVIAVALVCGVAWSAARSDDPDPKGGRASTCAEWAGKGGTNQLIQAREMLTSLRAVDGLDAPETPMAQRFAAGISNVCGGGRGGPLSEIAAALYLTERPTFG